MNLGRKLDSEILEKRKEKEERRVGKAKRHKASEGVKSGRENQNESQSLVSLVESPLCDSLGTDTGKQANRQGMQRQKANKDAKHERAKAKSESWSLESPAESPL